MIPGVEKLSQCSLGRVYQATELMYSGTKGSFLNIPTAEMTPC